MKAFDTISGINIDGTHPTTTAKDDSVVGAFDGTQNFADWVGQFFGLVQSLMNAADLTPDGNLEGVGTSEQVLQAIRLSKGIPGEIMIYMGQADPASLLEPPRILFLDGSLIEVAIYSDLADEVWCGTTHNATANAFYRTNSGDTVRSDGGTHMRLPDMRGQFLRGLDLAGAVDPDGVNRFSGSSQGDRFKSHEHSINIGSSFINENGSVNVATGTDLECAEIGAFSGSSFNAVGIGDSETRPVNIAAHFAIWY